MSETNQRKDQADILNLQTNIKKDKERKDEDRFKIHNSIHNKFAIRYFNMVANYLSRHKK